MNRVTKFVFVVALAVCWPLSAQTKPASPQPVNNVSITKTQAPVAQPAPQAATAKPESKPTESPSTEAAASEEKSSTKPAKSAGKGTGSPEQDKKIKSMAKQLTKSFAKAELTSEQQTMADELFGKTAKDYVTKRIKAEITDELEKKRAAGMKEARAAGKSVKEQVDAALVSAGFTEEQIKIYKSTQASLNKAKREFGKNLTDDQIAKLPKQLQSVINAK